MKIQIYTDGGCSGNQSDENIGGWGAILEYGEHKKELHGGEVNTTNNRMEMKALIAALSALKKEGLELEVFSDSSYLMNCFREKWYVSWRRNGWKNSKKEPVENRELWEELLELVEKQGKVEFFRVKGHVNLKSKSTNFDSLYEKFVEWNGARFTFEDFKYVTEMNNRADELANIAMDELR
jgi:ribonuclease HI